MTYSASYGYRCVNKTVTGNSPFSQDGKLFFTLEATASKAVSPVREFAGTYFSQVSPELVFARNRSGPPSSSSPPPSEYRTQVHCMLVGHSAADRADPGADGRHRGDVGPGGEEPRAELHAEFVRPDNLRRVHARSAVGAEVRRLLRVRRASEDVHGAADLADVRHERRRVDNKVRRPASSKGEVPRGDRVNREDSARCKCDT